MRKRDRNKLICRIDVTGFLSIQVALLAAFMAAAAFDVHPRPVDLFKAHHSIPMAKADREDALIIAVMRDGKVYFDTVPIRSADELCAQLQDRMRNGSQRRVYIRADLRARYRNVAEVLDQVHQAGIENVAFITEPARQ